MNISFRFLDSSLMDEVLLVENQNRLAYLFRKDADLTIGGKSYGKTPISVEKLLVGSYQVTLSKEGFGTETRTVSIIEGETFLLNVKLSSGIPININSNPQGASVYVDGTYFGTTPLKTQMVYGNYNINVSLDGIEKNETINVSEGGRNSWSFDLRKNSIGNLYTFSDGSKGIVFYIDSDGHGLVVSLDENEMQWCKSETDIRNIPNEGEFNKKLKKGLGATYTNYIINQLESSDAPAAEWCRAKGNEWYLPSAGELWQLLGVANEERGVSGPISEALKSNGGVSLYGWYWSSSEYSSSIAWGVDNFGHVHGNNKLNYAKTRVIRAIKL